LDIAIDIDINVTEDCSLQFYLFGVEFRSTELAMESESFEPGLGEAREEKRGTASTGPGLGRLDGIRRDIQRAKESGVAYDPRGTGRAWTHDFLNKKPWHPSSFRNQVRVWEAEQEELEKEKKDKRIREEYLAEKEYEKQLLLLDHGEAFRERHSVAFLYQKPPGYRGEGNSGERRNGDDPCDDEAKKLHHRGEKMESSSMVTDQNPRGEKKTGERHVEKVIHGFQAVMRQQQDRMELKSGIGMIGSASGGGASSSHSDYVFAEMNSSDEEKAYALATGRPVVAAKERKRHLRKQEKTARREERKKVKAAKEILKQAGIDADKLFEDGTSSSPRQRKKRHSN